MSRSTLAVAVLRTSVGDGAIVGGSGTTIGLTVLVGVSRTTIGLGSGGVDPVDRAVIPHAESTSAPTVSATTMITRRWLFEYLLIRPSFIVGWKPLILPCQIKLLGNPRQIIDTQHLQVSRHIRARVANVRHANATIYRAVPRTAFRIRRHRPMAIVRRAGERIAGIP